MLSLPRLCKVAVRLGKWIKGRPVEQELLPLTPGHLLNDYCLSRSEVLSQATVSACVNSLDRRGWPSLCHRAHRSRVTEAQRRHPIDPWGVCNKKLRAGKLRETPRGRCKGLLPPPSSSFPLMVLNVAEGWRRGWGGAQQCQISHRPTDWCRCTSCRKAWSSKSTLLFIV